MNVNIASLNPSNIRHGVLAMALGALLITVGCTNSAETLGSANHHSSSQSASKTGTLRDKPEVNETKDESGAKIIRETSTLSKKGTSIKVLVNRSPITNYDIKRRAAFLRLRRIGGNRTQKATEELIEERLKMQEASKQRTVVNDTIVDKAFGDFAKRNRMSTKQMGGVLGQAGVSAKHFKEFLRVQISWQRTVGTKVRSGSSNLSQSDALFNLRKSGEAKPETREYRLQQVIFVVPATKRKKLLRARGAEAKAFAQKFVSCKETLSQAKLLRDVAVKELGRVLEPELPPNWKADVQKTAEGKTTKTKETASGVEFLAVCSVRNVSDDKAAQLVSQSKEFESLNSNGNKIANDYLAELRSKATIVYR